jgi:hypothetical protein
MPSISFHYIPFHSIPLQGSNLFYYNSREIFESDPSKTVKNRPVDVSGYSVAAHNADQPPYLLELLVGALQGAGGAGGGGGGRDVFRTVDAA